MTRLCLLLASATLALVHCDRPSGGGGQGGGPPQVKTAMDACERFVTSGAASGCESTTVEPALTPGARERVVFRLPSGHRGQVFDFEDNDSYAKSAKSIEDISAAGRHRWGNERAKIYVQLNKDATDAEAAKIKSILDGF
jgi:hypothetical protein